MSVISAACCARTSPTATPRALTRPYATRAPFPATSTPPALGNVVAIPLVAGLHHRYHRAA